jgi:hypothetical protein
MSSWHLLGENEKASRASAADLFTPLLLVVTAGPPLLVLWVCRAIHEAAPGQAHASALPTVPHGGGQHHAERIRLSFKMFSLQ